MIYTCPCGKVYGTGTDDDKKSELRRYCPVCAEQLVGAYGEFMGVYGEFMGVSIEKVCPNKKSEV